MKLVTFNDGQVGYVDGEAVVELRVGSHVHAAADRLGASAAR